MDNFKQYIPIMIKIGEHILNYLVKEIFDRIKNKKISDSNAQASVKPWLVPDYDNSDVIVKENYGNLILFINIALKNTGVNPALNMKFVPYGDDFLDDYFKIEGDDEYSYFIYKDIEGESVPKEEIVTFSIQKPIAKYVKCSSGFISFKLNIPT